MNLYLLFKSLHLIAVISWMAGLLYLPRIFVYHVENFQKKEATEVFEIMEMRLYNYIMKTLHFKKQHGTGKNIDKDRIKETI